jgi:hypothetical protein
MRWFEFDLTEGGERTLQEELFAGGRLEILTGG